MLSNRDHHQAWKVLHYTAESRHFRRRTTQTSHSVPKLSVIMWMESFQPETAHADLYANVCIAGSWLSSGPFGIHATRLPGPCAPCDCSGSCKAARALHPGASGKNSCLTCLVLPGGFQTLSADNLHLACLICMRAQQSIVPVCLDDNVHSSPLHPA